MAAERNSSPGKEQFSYGNGAAGHPIWLS